LSRFGSTCTIENLAAIMKINMLKKKFHIDRQKYK
jgi:hypothetical protein